MVVSVLDDVLAAIDSHLAQPEPEQGGALLRPVNGRSITRFEWDETAATTPVSYVPSATLVRDVADLERALDLSLVGIVHSHPDGLNRLSGPDLEVTRHLLQLNRHLGWVCMPIVTQGVSLAASGTHETSVDHGLVSWFIARLDEHDTLHVARPASVRSVPVAALVHAVCDKLGWEPRGREDLTIQGATLIGCPFAPPDADVTVWLLLSHDYPMAAPLVAVDAGDGIYPHPVPVLADIRQETAIDRLCDSLLFTLHCPGSDALLPGTPEIADEDPDTPNVDDEDTDPEQERA